MCNKALFCLISCAVGLAPRALQAQQATNDPTMQQTVGFLSETLEKQGPLTITSSQHPDRYSAWSGTVKLEGECSLLVTTRYRSSSHYFTGSILSVDLKKSEASSVAITPVTDSIPQVFSLSIEKAYREVRSSHIPVDDSPATAIAENEDLSADVVSNAGGTLLIITLDGRLRTLTPSKKLKISIFRDGKDLPATSQDAVAGDHITTWPGNKSLTIYKDFPKEQNGYGGISVALVGDRDTANRMAKTLIHALVLCHKDDKPLLF